MSNLISALSSLAKASKSSDEANNLGAIFSFSVICFNSTRSSSRVAAGALARRKSAFILGQFSRGVCAAFASVCKTSGTNFPLRPPGNPLIISNFEAVFGFVPAKSINVSSRIILFLGIFFVMALFSRQEARYFNRFKKSEL